ncbi:MAG: hypothetical protein JO129_01115 [Candidatus Dependentiae bacterium]|nr:hypothetical protein [Candidatus Dependentiae bacterium]
MKSRGLALFLMLLFFQESVLFSKIDIGAMIKSMGSMFGAPPLGFVYNFEVWNDASVPVYVEQEGIASFMGAFFPSAKGYFGKKTLPSIFDIQGAVSQAVYMNENYYFNFYISTHSDAHIDPIYTQSLTQLPLAQHDPNVYYYHVYTSGEFSKGSLVHNPQVELMGYINTSPQTTSASVKSTVTLSSQLSTLAFYNSSGTDVQVSLTYGSAPYTFTVEKYSYNSLTIPTPQAAPSTSSTTNITGASATPANTPQASASSSKASVAQTTGNSSVSIQSVSSSSSTAASTSVAPAFSLRPNTITFSAYDASAKKYNQFRTLMLPSQGFDGITYTIEIFQDPGKNLEVGIQGLTPGNYSVGVSPRIRDVTPCPCTFWYQSFAQAGSVAGYSDLPGQIWVVYAGTDSPIISKVIPGQVVSWNLTRPLIDQGDQFVYFVYVVTTNDTVAQTFVTKLAQQLIGQNVVQEYEQAINAAFVAPSKSELDQGLDVTDKTSPVVQSISPEEQIATLMGALTVSGGVIEDKAQGVIGYIVGTDIFMPCGLGFGRFYYTLAPSIISVSNLVASITNYLDSSKTSTLGNSATAIQSAITTTVNNWLNAYMQNPKTVQTQVEQFLVQYGNSQIISSDGTGLSKFGQTCLQLIMSGSMSLKFPSLQLSTVQNEYVYNFGNAAPDKMPTSITTINPVASLPNVTASTVGTASKSIVKPTRTGKSSKIQRPKQS